MSKRISLHGLLTALCASAAQFCLPANIVESLDSFPYIPDNSW